MSRNLVPGQVYSLHDHLYEFVRYDNDHNHAIFKLIRKGSSHFKLIRYSEGNEEGTHYTTIGSLNYKDLKLDQGYKIKKRLDKQVDDLLK